MSREKPLRRVCAYIDGFNLYHAIDGLGKDHLKWIILRKLAESFLREREELAKTVLFTAVLNWNAEKQKRHRTFIAAQKAVGVEVEEAKFKKGTRHCRRFNRYCDFYEEKQTDVSIAVTLLADAYEDMFDRALLFSADTDQVPLIRFIQARFPEKRLTLVAPPGRLSQARELGGLFAERYEITEGRLGTCSLSREVCDSQGRKVAIMPAKCARQSP